MQKALLSKWDWPDQLTRDIGTSAKPMSVLSGPEHPVLSQVFPPYDKKIVQSFMTRFRGQRKGGFFGMSLFDVEEGLLGGLGILGRKGKNSKPKTINQKGLAIIG